MPKMKTKRAAAPRLEESSARGQGTQAAAPAAQGGPDREGGRASSASARSVSLRGGQQHATRQGWRQDTPPPEEDSQEGQGLRRRPLAPVSPRRRDRAA